MNVPFEFYAEEIEPHKQLSCLHMIAEANLLKIHGNDSREEVRASKKSGNEN